jgi:hypothetical protein
MVTHIPFQQSLVAMLFMLLWILASLEKRPIENESKWRNRDNWGNGKDNMNNLSFPIPHPILSYFIFLFHLILYFFSHFSLFHFYIYIGFHSLSKVHQLPNFTCRYRFLQPFSCLDPFQIIPPHWEAFWSPKSWRKPS